MMLGQQRQERLEIIARERLDIHLRARQHVAHRDRLEALRRRIGRRDDVDALPDERQSHLHEYLFGRPGVNRERRRLRIRETLTDRLDDILAGGHVGERDLAHGVGRRLSDDDVAVDIAQFNLDGRNAQPLDHDGDHDAAGAGRSAAVWPPLVELLNRC